MGQYVTPRGVVLTLGDVAARAVGYKPVEKPKASTSEKKPARKASAQKSDDE
jgi:hypothetical protein